MEDSILKLADNVAIVLWVVSAILASFLIVSIVRSLLYQKGPNVNRIDTNSMELVSREETNGVIEEIYIKGNRKVTVRAWKEGENDNDSN